MRVDSLQALKHDRLDITQGLTAYATTLHTFDLPIPILLAPMAGITDLPYRTMARRFGAPYCVGEMLSSKRELLKTPKSSYRRLNEDEPSPRVVQLVGTDPQIMAEAARYNQDIGADVIDINMGCPAKKVCKVAAGSALMADEARVAQIVSQVVKAVSIPVSVKIRTGLHKQNRNAPRIARIIEENGARWITVHGRTRACGFKGTAEYDTIASVVRAVAIPVIANGDIKTFANACQVINATGARAVMVGRASYGRPWIFQEFIAAAAGSRAVIPWEQRLHTIDEHLDLIHQHYGSQLGVKIARKHIGWYLGALAADAGVDSAIERQQRVGVNRVDNTAQQRKMALAACDALLQNAPLVH